MSGLSVVIPSRTLANLKPCVDAVRKHEPDAQIVVIWDGDCGTAVIDGKSKASSTDELWTVQRLLNDAGGGVVFNGWKPFVFARNCNLGIQANDEDDVVLLNDDAILESSGGFSLMQREAQDPTIGLVSATTNVAGNPAQHRRALVPGWPSMRIAGVTPGNSFPTVAFVCVLIPRRTIETVGLLDERFNPGMYEDNDYCRRVHNAGLKIGIHDGAFVNHNVLKPTFRSSPTAGADLAAARKIYLDKWGTP